MEKYEPQYWMPQWGKCSARELRAHDVYEQLKYDRNSWVFVNPWGSGDIYAMVSLMDDFIKYHCANGEKIVLLVRKAYEEIPFMFSQYADRLAVITVVKEYMDAAVQDLGLQQTFSRGEPINFVPTHWGQGDLQKFYHLRGTTACDLFKFMLHIPFDAVPAKPVLPDVLVSRAEAKLNGIFDPSRKSVLLSPSSVTLKAFPDAFWAGIAQRLKAMGYRIFCDTANGKAAPIEGTEELRFTFGEAVTIANKIGGVICHETGLTHVFSSSSCKLTIFYPGPLPAPWYGVPFSAVSLHNGGFRQTEEGMEIPEDASVDEAIARAMDVLTPLYA